MKRSLHLRPDRNAIRERDLVDDDEFEGGGVGGGETKELELNIPNKIIKKTTPTPLELPPAPLEPPPVLSFSSLSPSPSTTTSSNSEMKNKNVEEENNKNNNSNTKPKKVIPSLAQVLETLAWYFLPDTDLPEFKSFEHLLVPLEEAWRYYIDVYRVVYADSLPALKFKGFVMEMFSKNGRLSRLKDILEQFSQNGDGLEEIINGFTVFKATRPAAGAVLLDTGMKRILLVKGTWKKAKWTFPRGKLKEGEEAICGALREVLEETGIDLRSYIDLTEKPLEIKGNQTNGRGSLTLFVGCGIPDDGRKYAPLTRNEVSEVKWFSLQEIRSDSTKFVSISPLIPKIDNWIALKKQKLEQQKEQKEKEKEEQSQQTTKLRQPPSWLQPKQTQIQQFDQSQNQIIPQQIIPQQIIPQQIVPQQTIQIIQQQPPQNPIQFIPIQIIQQQQPMIETMPQQVILVPSPYQPFQDSYSSLTYIQAPQFFY